MVRFSSGNSSDGDCTGRHPGLGHCCRENSTSVHNAWPIVDAQPMVTGWMDGWMSRGMNESVDDTPIRIMHLEMCGLNEF